MADHDNIYDDEVQNVWLFNKLVDEDTHNCEASSESASSICSDAEPEMQDFEPDEFDAIECEEDAENGKDHIVCGRTWRYIAPKKKDTIECDSHNCPLTEKSKTIDTIDECFHLFINDEIINAIILHTNNKRNESTILKSRWNPVDRTEIDAFLGLLLLMGRFHESRERKHDLWRQNRAYSRPFYAAAMPCDRFIEILKHIRFDDYATREERKATDKLAALRDITNIFVKNCRDSYSASSIGTIDEQLVTFRGRCSFKVHMPNKSGKYGMKIWTLCDAKSFYCCNMDIYLGKSGDVCEKQQGKQVVKQLTNFWQGSNRAITMNNLFTDISLAEELLASKIFLTGPIRKSKPDLPKILTQIQRRQQYSTDFLFTNNLTLVSYTPKQRTRIILLSSLQHEHSISCTENNCKPNIINYYNAAKNSVDILDKIVREYTCKHCTRRWPLSLFMHYIDIAAYNAFVIWITKNPTWESQNSMKRRRKIFLEELAKKLVANNINRRAIDFENRKVNFHQYIVDAIEATGRKITKTIIEKKFRKRSRCYICVGNNNKYHSTCDNCNKYVCSYHSTQRHTIVCNRCIETSRE